jgi:uncharacterized membrane protein YkoI
LGERSNREITMKKRTIWISSAAAGAALVLGGTAVAFAATDGFEADDDRTGSSQGTEEASEQLTGADLEKATEAALAEAGAGEVTEAETEDGGTTAYELDVLLDSGESVEVSLDANFDVVQVEADDADDADDTDDDADDIDGD